MAAANRAWLRWLVAGGILIALALALWLAQARGWLAPLESWLRGEIPQNHAAHSGADMQGKPGMQMGDREPAEAESAVEGYAPVVIEPGLEQRIGVTIGTVEREPLRMSVQTVGIVEANETKTNRVHLRTDGWVEELFINFTGQTVNEGDPLLAIYIPEFLTTQREYLTARRSGREGAARRLELWGVGREELEELVRTGEPRPVLTLRSPIGGTVLEKNVLEGDYLTPECELYVISDLSTVWVQGQVYQYELPHVELEQPATVTVPGLPGYQFEGKVVFIQPTVEEATRTAQVRVELDNPDGLLKPGMFVELEIQHPMGDGLLVPVAAVFRTGERDIVFRAEEGNRYVPVEVEISPMKFEPERYHVLAGLKAGDRIITSANFLIDSESRLRFGGGGMMPGMPGMEMDMEGMDGMEGTEGMEEGQGMDHSQMKH